MLTSFQDLRPAETVAYNLLVYRSSTPTHGDDGAKDSYETSRLGANLTVIRHPGRVEDRLRHK